MSLITQAECPICQAVEFLALATLDHRELVACRICGHHYVRIFSPSALTQAYQKDYYQSANDPRIQAWIDKNRRVWDGLVHDITDSKTKITELLDIGAGTGGFLESFHRSHPLVKIAAVESSIYACQNLTARLPTLSILAPDTESLDQISESFSAISLLQVLEHVGNPRSVMKEIYRLLKPGGVLLLTVPNRRSYHVSRHGFKDSHCYNNSTHLHFFNDKSLRRTLQTCGFSQVKRISRWGGGETVGWRQVPQYFLRLLGRSSELRYLVFK